MRTPKLGKGRLSLRRASRLALCLPLGGEIASWSFPCACSRLELRCRRLVLCTSRSCLIHVPKPVTSIAIIRGEVPLATFRFVSSQRFPLVAGPPSVCHPCPGSSAQLTGTDRLRRVRLILLVLLF